MARAVPTVFVASTAYNFLNVFRPHETPHSSSHPLSKNPVLELAFADEATASAAFAILSSRLVYWWWHVNGDGFHVTHSFIANLPLTPSSLAAGHVEVLRVAGDRLWRALQRHRIVSRNGRRETVAYKPLSCEQERDTIDAALVEAIDLPSGLTEELRTYVHNTVIVDDADVRRRSLRSHFDREEAAE